MFDFLLSFKWSALLNDSVYDQPNLTLTYKSKPVYPVYLSTRPLASLRRHNVRFLKFFIIQNVEW